MQTVQTRLPASYLLKGNAAGARDCSCPCNPCDCNPCECPGASRWPGWRLSLYQLVEGHFERISLYGHEMLLLCLALPQREAEPTSWQEVILCEATANPATVLKLLEGIEEYLEALPAEVQGTVRRPTRRAVYAVPLVYQQEGTTPLLRVDFAPSTARLLRAAEPEPAWTPPAWSYNGPLASRGLFVWQSPLR
ncbi:MAG: hypothetical protein IRZ31_11090 [Thermogemmatispora sp.]|uniref:hypothetical protein n=1 Tax=Thermogemmatispora sp. TaxID=1968838 RepID=UPI0026117C34|nr:hypothetical protein [Thermogemmatispora sp.]MBX5457436.1 hypothetical protein [Thermogemmatispora sp.]